MIKHIDGRNDSESLCIKVRSCSGATAGDILDYVKPLARKKPKRIVIHTRTSDLPNDFDTISKMKKVIKSIREIAVNQEIQITFSGVINQEISIYVQRFVFINNSILDISSLNWSQLQLNQKGTSLLCRDLAKSVKVCRRSR